MKECAKYLGQTTTFQQQETTEIRSRIRAACASFYRDKLELTSESYLLQHRLRLLNMMITPTLSYAAGTWTLPKEHQRMIRSTRRKMIPLIVQTKRKYRMKVQGSREGKEMKSDEEPENKKDDEEDEESHKNSKDEAVEGNSSNTDCDQNSDVSFMNDTDEEIDTAEIEEEDWIEYIMRTQRKLKNKWCQPTSHVGLNHKER